MPSRVAVAVGLVVLVGRRRRGRTGVKPSWQVTKLTLWYGRYGVARVVGEQVVAAVEPLHQRRHHARIAPDEAADVVAEPAVPLLPE